MLSLLRTMTLRELLLAEGPSLVGSVAIAELFYKFHSFTLECMAFLGTWCIVSAVVRQFAGVLGRPAEEPPVA